MSVFDEKENSEVAFTLEKAARFAGVSAPTMLQWANRRDFPAFRAGRRWVIPKDSLIDWLRKQAQERAQL